MLADKLSDTPSLTKDHVIALRTGYIQLISDLRKTGYHAYIAKPIILLMDERFETLVKNTIYS